MKAASRKPTSISEQRRNNLQLARRRATAVRELYPSVEQLRIRLVFDDGGPRTHSPQAHAFYPAAQAFFRFPCPCAECDGDFDLSGSVGELVHASKDGRHEVRKASGRLHCEGVRLRDRTGSRNCAMMLEYQLVADRGRADR